ncbi:transcription factor 7-like 1-A [Corythoichthys intestinalis]|uniref:transcription factor 7-like 1-A n=1 Tax=Corythoichthys intestinalis TaxID=161448 RepID=UPI0025A56259|nr:transcription factor 7-like 1-A [Corythoichthys intestinalis]XP_061800499.1 transcription factor 7-like 1-A [Nerophis lumbriciformis]
MPQLSDDGDLGASDELIRFKDEDEHKRSGDAERDLDDVKSSLVHESESDNGAQAASRRAGPEPDEAERARHSQLFAEALRRQSGAFFQPSPYLGYPFFVIPEMYASYLAGGLATGAYLPFRWPSLDLPGGTAARDSPVSRAAALATAITSVSAHAQSSSARVHPGHHPLLSHRPEAFSAPRRPSPDFSPDAGSSHTASRTQRTVDWPEARSAHPMTGGESPLALDTSSGRAASGFPASGSRPVSVKQEPREHGERKSSPVAAAAPREAEEKAKGHIKKPLNAFMLFMRDERPNVVAQCQVKESATINQILGQRWHSLSKERQASYYELARKERLLHSQLYPGWSARDNYGKKKKRKKSKSDNQTDAAEALPPDLSRPHPVSHLTHTHLSQASPASSADSPATPGAALASPAAPAPTRTEHSRARSSSPLYADRPLDLATKRPRPASLDPPLS